MPGGMDSGTGAEIIGIDHVQLAMPAGREDDARRFYAGLLGLHEVPKPAPLARRGGCWFATADGRVAVHLGVEDEFRPARKAHPAFVVADFDGMLDRLAHAGIEIGDDDSIAARRCYIADPFGNRVELVDEADRGFSAPANRATSQSSPGVQGRVP